MHAWLDEGKIKTSNSNSLRFLIAVKGYTKTSSKGILKIRAPKIFDQFLAPDAKNKLPTLSLPLIEGIKKAFDEGLFIFLFMYTFALDCWNCNHNSRELLNLM